MANKLIECQICKEFKRPSYVMAVELLRKPMIELLKQHHPELSEQGSICFTDLNKYRAIYMQSLLEKEKGELTNLEKDVVRSLRKHELLAKDINKEFERKLTFGEKIADQVAVFGGSWYFILSSIGFLLIWVILNAFVFIKRPFDPYPFILLNLILSSVAALQAPIIMMSQNRQAAKDRLRSEEEYRVNLKAELMIRHLNQKMDQLLSNQWQRLLEIQQIQLDFMEDLFYKKENKPYTKNNKEKIAGEKQIGERQESTAESDKT